MNNVEAKRVRGVFEKNPGSGVWWVRFIDAEGALRREKAGSKSAAIKLYRKRKNEALEGNKLPKKLRSRAVLFGELADDYLAHAKANNEGWKADKDRIATLKAAFGNRPVAIPIADLREWFNTKEWKPST